MGVAFSDIESLIHAATAEALDRKELEDFCSQTGKSIQDCTNEAALTIAKRFDAFLMGFDDADRAMNHLWQAMIEQLHSNGTDIWEPLYSIYLAFDEGEWPHGGINDPVNFFTRPAIKLILSGTRYSS